MVEEDVRMMKPSTLRCLLRFPDKIDHEQTHPWRIELLGPVEVYVHNYNRS